MVKLSDGVMLIGGNEKIGHRYKKEFLKLKSVTSKWEISDVRASSFRASGGLKPGFI